MVTLDEPTHTSRQNRVSGNSIFPLNRGRSVAMPAFVAERRSSDTVVEEESASQSEYQFNLMIALRLVLDKTIECSQSLFFITLQL